MDGEFPREVGRYNGPELGPLVICIGGMHGNEPAGVFAARRVLQDLHNRRPAFSGRLVALTGNRAALARGSRYCERDLNRMWTTEDITRLTQQPQPCLTSPEDAEQLDLLKTIETLLAERQGPAVFLDLHTTSAKGVPFSVISDTLSNRHLALNLPAPIILGLEEHLDGTILNYINDLGHLAIGFEGGQNADSAAVDHHEVAIWTILMSVGCIREERVPQFASLRDKLAHATRQVPQVLEIRAHQRVEEEDGFVMQPGYTNFQAVRRGQTLAHNDRGIIQAQTTGHILMPLYQKQGSDGFFIVAAVKPIWLTLSRGFRSLRLERALPWLPGVRRHPEQVDTLIVNPKVARWLVLQFFHLLGFRRQRVDGPHLLVSRRRHDLVTED